MPAELGRPPLIGLVQVPARELVAAGRIFRRFVDPAERDRIDLQRVREFVNRRFQCERTDRFAGRAHPGIGDGVEVHHPLTDKQILHGVHVARGERALFGIAGVVRRCGRARMNECGQGPVAPRPERDALLRHRATADDAEYVLARQRQFDGAVGDLRRRGTEHGVLPESGLAAECAADETGHHLHLVVGETEDVRQRVTVTADGLRGVEYRQTAIVVPPGNRRVRFDRVVIVGRRSVEGVDRHLRVGQRLAGVTDGDLGRFAQDVSRWCGFRLEIVEGQARRLLVVGDAYE